MELSRAFAVPFSSRNIRKACWDSRWPCCLRDSDEPDLMIERYWIGPSLLAESNELATSGGLTASPSSLRKLRKIVLDSRWLALGDFIMQSVDSDFASLASFIVPFSVLEICSSGSGEPPIN
mmetsp:Transcript_94602/g.163580  ORF Transcript_94602/g.163580 Transcript_94602/m.163580 type:complete len:122 (-) Transcript_94602:29-394(-)